VLFSDIRLQKILWHWNPVSGHSRSVKTTFDTPSIITYFCWICLLSFLIYLISKILRPWNLDQESLKVIETGTIQQIGYGFLLVFYRNFFPKRCWLKPLSRQFGRVRGLCSAFPHLEFGVARVLWDGLAPSWRSVLLVHRRP